MKEAECLVQPNSICSKLDIDAALRESVSFGRFVTEPLEWGKWSSFNQNRYLEEAERYSTRGSVAEKKAYFESHYKRVAAAKKKAAQLLKQAGGGGEDGDGCCSPTGADYDGSWQSGMEDDWGTETGEDRWALGDDGTYSISNSARFHTVKTQQVALQPDHEMIGAGGANGIVELPEEAGGDSYSASCCVKEGRTSTSHFLEEIGNLGKTLHNLDEVVDSHIISSHGGPWPEGRLGVVEAPETEQDIANAHYIPEMEQSSEPKPRYESSPLQENSNNQIPARDKAESPPIIKHSILSTKPAVPPPVPATTSHGKENNPTLATRNKSRKHTNDKPVPIDQSPQLKGKNITPETTRAPPPKPDKTWNPKVAFSCFRTCQDLGNARPTPRKSSARGTPKAETSKVGDDRKRLSFKARPLPKFYDRTKHPKQL